MTELRTEEDEDGLSVTGAVDDVAPAPVGPLDDVSCFEDEDNGVGEEDGVGEEEEV